MAKIEEYRSLFMTGSLILILAAATPTLGLFIRVPDGSEKFSELWLLGTGQKAENYPFNVTINESFNEKYSVYVGVGNHLGYSTYYRVDVKFRNQTQPFPDSSNSVPSPLNSTYEFQFLLADGKTWETPLIFSFQGEPMFVSDILINDVVFPVNRSSTWDPKLNGFYYHLFFELWLYNMTSRNFQYHNRFVNLRLNVTSHGT